MWSPAFAHAAYQVPLIGVGCLSLGAYPRANLRHCIIISQSTAAEYDVSKNAKRPFNDLLCYAPFTLALMSLGEHVAT